MMNAKEKSVRKADRMLNSTLQATSHLYGQAKRRSSRKKSFIRA